MAGTRSSLATLRIYAVTHHAYRRRIFSSNCLISTTHATSVILMADLAMNVSTYQSALNVKILLASQFLTGVFSILALKFNDAEKKEKIGGGRTM